MKVNGLRTFSLPRVDVKWAKQESQMLMASDSVVCVCVCVCQRRGEPRGDLRSSPALELKKNEAVEG